MTDRFRKKFILVTVIIGILSPIISYILAKEIDPNEAKFASIAFPVFYILSVFILYYALKYGMQLTKGLRRLNIIFSIISIIICIPIGNVIDWRIGGWLGIWFGFIAYCLLFLIISWIIEGFKKPAIK